MNTQRLSPYPLLLLLFVAPVAGAADSAHDWLMKVDRAARTLNFEGIFVYQHGDALETMRIVHRVDRGTVRERVVALNGVPREIIRSDGEVQCFLPDEHAVVVEHRRADSKAFPAILPERVSDLEENYLLELGDRGRVASRDAQMIRIQPRDRYRYGYQLWADTATGLLLKAVLLDDKGRTVEQFMFTQVNPRAAIAEGDLAPQNAPPGAGWRREEGEARINDDSPAWAATELPPGFKLTTRLTRSMPTRKTPVEHLVYSDGLAAVSVFIEPAAEGRRGPDRASRMGAVHAYGKLLDDHRVTVVGEVPEATVDMIGRSVKSLQ